MARALVNRKAIRDEKGKAKGSLCLRNLTFRWTSVSTRALAKRIDSDAG